MQPVQVWLANTNGKLHSEFGSGPDMVEQVGAGVVVGCTGPETKQADDK